MLNEMVKIAFDLFTGTADKPFLEARKEIGVKMSASLSFPAELGELFIQSRVIKEYYKRTLLNCLRINLMHKHADMYICLFYLKSYSHFKSKARGCLAFNKKILMNC